MSPRSYPFPRVSVCLLSVAVFLSLVVLPGCVPRPAAMPDGQRPPAMSVKEFYEFCSALPVPGGCLSDPICLRYRDELASPPPDLGGCLTLCQQTQNALYVANLTNGCGGILERAEALCDQFCRRRAGQ